MLPRLLISIFLLFVWVTGLKAAPAEWRVEGEHGTLFIFGTMHRLPEGFDWFSDDLKDHLSNSRLLVLETESSQAADDYLGFLVRQPGVAVSKKSLKNRLENKDYQAFLSQMKGFGLHEEDVTNLRPWYAALLLSRLKGDEAGLERNEGVEVTLTAFSKAKNIELMGLESPGQQFRQFSELPKRVELGWLENVIRRGNTNGEDSIRLSDAWLSGDLGTLELLALGSLLETPGLYKVLIKERNRNWARQLGRLLDEGGQIFVAVGAAHLVGDDSLLHLLKERGYRVIRE